MAFDAPRNAVEANLTAVGLLAPDLRLGRRHEPDPPGVDAVEDRVARRRRQWSLPEEHVFTDHARFAARLSEATGLQFVYTTQATGNPQTQAIPAGLPPEEGLKQMLAGTGLRMAQRQPGAGAQLLLLSLLASAGIDPPRMYDSTAWSLSSPASRSARGPTPARARMIPTT